MIGVLPAAVVFSGLVVIGAAGLGLWYLTHLGSHRVVRDSDLPAGRFHRRRGIRRGLMVAGLVLLAGAFFVGVNFIPYKRGDREANVLFATYWSVVLLFTLALLVFAVVDILLTRQFQRRRERDVLVGAFRRDALDRRPRAAEGEPDDDGGQ